VDNAYGAACVGWVLAAEQAEAALYADHSYIRSRVPLVAMRETTPWGAREMHSEPIRVKHPKIASLVLGEVVEPAEDDIPHSENTKGAGAVFPWLRINYRNGGVGHAEFPPLTTRVDNDGMPRVELAGLAHLYSLVYKGSPTARAWYVGQRYRRTLLDLALNALPRDGTECFRLPH
jgi:hypothetical protein